MMTIRRCTIALCAILLLCEIASSDSGDGADAFCNKAKVQFNALIRLCRPDRSVYWHQRYDDSVKKTQQKFDELNLTSRMLEKEPNANELKGVFAYDYLNTVHEVQLDQYTALVEDLGRELVNDKINAAVMPTVRRLDLQFATFQGKPHSDSLEKSYAQFLDFRHRLDHFESEIPVAEDYLFEPRANAYASEPIKHVQYQVHDWIAGLNKVDALATSLQPIQDSVETARFFAPKDPIPWLPVATQLSVLLVSMAGWIKSYHDETALWLIGLFVLGSMGLSFYLVFSSTETLWNIARQSLIPGLFIVYWIGKKKGWWGYWIERWKESH